MCMEDIRIGRNTQTVLTQSSGGNPQISLLPNSSRVGLLVTCSVGATAVLVPDKGGSGQSIWEATATDHTFFVDLHTIGQMITGGWNLQDTAGGNSVTTIETILKPE